MLHPDEHAFIAPIVDMVSRHSWEATFYARPDQFEAKCLALPYLLLAKAVYGMPIAEAFKEHEFAFLLIARAYTALFGAGLSVLAAAYVAKIVPPSRSGLRRASQISAAFVIAFAAIFIEHSAYATSDIPLSFFILLFAFFCTSYLEGGRGIQAVLCAVTIGVGISIKYPAAILAIFLAAAVVFRVCAIERQPALRCIAKIGKYAAACIFATALALFVIAPNLFTDCTSVMEAIAREARDTHLGADRLGFFGNLLFYAENLMRFFGLVSLPAALVGIIFLIKERSRSALTLLVGLLYWVCMSILSLHWVRWGMPVYVFYAVAVSIGLGEAMAMAWRLFESRADSAVCLGKVAGCIIYLIVGAFFLNVLLSGMAQTKYAVSPDTRVIALEYCRENGITKENSIYESYTPLCMSLGGAMMGDAFSLEEGHAVTASDDDAEYFVSSSTYIERYRAEPERYADMIAIYDDLLNMHEVVYEIDPARISQDPFVLRNTILNAGYLASPLQPSGNTITILRIR